MAHLFLNQERLVGWIRAGGICVRVGELSKIPSKGGATEQRGGDTKILKREGQAGSRGGCLKKGG